MRERDRTTESGSVIFYILICCALFAALGIATANMMRGPSGGGRNNDKVRLYATELLDYGNTMRDSIRAMQIGGVDDASLCFDAPGWGSGIYNQSSCGDAVNKVFDPAGGAVVWQASPTGVNDGSPWIITGINGIKAVGTTCGDASCADLKLVLANITTDACLAINEQLGIPAIGGAPPQDKGYDSLPYVGSYSISATGDIGDEASSSGLAGKGAGCFRATVSPAAGKLYFYRVLVTR